MGSAAQLILVTIGQCVRKRNLRWFHSHYRANADFKVSTNDTSRDHYSKANTEATARTAYSLQFKLIAQC